MSQKRKFMFVYLTTGAGHISTARVMKECILKNEPNAEVVMVNGFDKKNFWGQVILEQGYYVSTNFFHGLYPLAYDLARFRFFQSFMLRFFMPHTVRYLRKIIKKEKPTDIVSFHFALSPCIKQALKSSDSKINLSVMVTDPFTVPNVWFYEKSLQYFVYSEQAKEIGMNLKVPEKNIHIVPFALNPKYQIPFDKDDITSLKKKHGFDLNKKVLLIVGGGDGIPGAIEIINKCILRKAKFSVAVICGHDLVKKTYLEGLKVLYPKFDLHVYGFINYLDELVKLSDCVVMKAGPATLVEVLSCKKPVIICRYIHNQEKGNMQFAVNNKVGFFIQSPGKIYDKVEELLADEHFDEKMKERFAALNIDTDTNKTAKLLLEK
ncbi:MAG: glycosyltransferase [Spirochaetia bacterium]|nr:glycosyltransferase [Spirochaetia bacterium]MDD7698006.1 glycosyltransferase [Spirochaetia bacterium]MDY4209897.1 glycosyltransferase [Treponema sp.]